MKLLMKFSKFTLVQLSSTIPIETKENELGSGILSIHWGLGSQNE